MLHVDGASLTVSDSANLELTLDPVSAKVGGGDALDATGSCFCHSKLTMSDGDITRYPVDSWLGVNVTEALG